MQHFGPIYLFSPSFSFGFPGGSVSKESACKGGDCLEYRRQVFNPWVGKFPWSRKWQPTPVFLPEKSMNRVAWQLLFDFSSIAVKEFQSLDSRLLFCIHLLYPALLVKIACCLVGHQKSDSLWLLPYLGMRSTR